MSSSSSHCYETVYVLKSGTSESDVAAVHQKVDNVISKFQGKLKHRDDWGIKELAYTIGKETSGRFCSVNYSGDSGVVEEIERHFKILENVIRFLTVSVEEDYDYTKIKKQAHMSEEEVKKNRELRKKMQ